MAKKKAVVDKPPKKVVAAERKVKNAERSLKAHRSDARKKTQKLKSKHVAALAELKAAKSG